MEVTEIFSIAFGTFGVSFALLREVFSSSRLKSENTISLYEMLHKEDIRVARHSIKSIMECTRRDKTHFLDLSAEDRSKLSVTCASFDYFGILYKQNKINRSILLKTWAPIIYMCYEELDEFIVWRRKFWTAAPNAMWSNFDYIYKEACNNLEIRGLSRIS